MVLLLAGREYRGGKTFGGKKDMVAKMAGN